MDEVVPVILGAVFGAVIWCCTRGRARFILSVLAVIVAGVAATVASGEYLESRIYLFLDLGEAAFGLAVGYVIAARLLPAPANRNSAQTPR